MRAQRAPGWCEWSAVSGKGKWVWVRVKVWVRGRVWVRVRVWVRGRG